jgi:hypothetical protein
MELLDPYVIEFDDLNATGELRFNAIGLVVAPPVSTA